MKRLLESLRPANVTALAVVKLQHFLGVPLNDLYPQFGIRVPH